MENSLYDITARLQRSEENSQYMHVKQQLMVDTINKLLYFNQELSRTVLSLVPRENPIHRDGKLSHIEDIWSHNLIRSSRDFARRDPAPG